jgi:hypothetical protein
MAVEIAHGRLQEQEPVVSLLKHEQVDAAAQRRTGVSFSLGSPVAHQGYT